MYWSTGRRTGNTRSYSYTRPPLLTFYHSRKCLETLIGWLLTVCVLCWTRQSSGLLSMSCAGVFCAGVLVCRSFVSCAGALADAAGQEIPGHPFIQPCSSSTPMDSILICVASANTNMIGMRRIGYGRRKFHMISRQDRKHHGTHSYSYTPNPASPVSLQWIQF